MDLASLSISAGTALATSLATNAGKVPIETLDNLWYLTFRKFNNFVAERRALDTHNLEMYRQTIADEVNQISESDLKAPEMSIVGPALEASKYYIDEEVLRDMFAKVVAAAMDKSKIDILHHSFVEIIKQLSPEDAKNISLLKNNPHQGIVRYAGLIPNNGGYDLLRTHVFLGDLPDIIDGTENSTSVTNLERLGLIIISYDENFNDNSYYEPYKQTTYFKTMTPYMELRDRQMDIITGTMRLSPLGQSFIKVCV